MNPLYSFCAQIHVLSIPAVRWLGATVVALSCLFNLPTRGATVVAPNEFAAIDANIMINTPLRGTNLPRTYQMQFAPVVLGGLPVGARVTGLRFRLDATNNSGNFPLTNVTWADYEITLAQAANAVSNMSTAFASNMVSPVLVRDGALTINSNSFTAGGNPNAFGPLFAFDAPYVYQGGDLVVLLSHPGSDSINSEFVDAVFNTSSYGTNYRAFSANGFNTNTATAETAVPIVQLEYVRFDESETNDTKFGANAVGPMTAGDAIFGTSTGFSTAAGIGSADNFRVTLATNAPGIYRQRLVLDSLTPGHTGTIRGLTQAAGVPNAGTDSVSQTSLATTTPARFNQFYTFGAASQFYYRVTGAAATTNSYTATLQTLPVTPVSLGNFPIGSSITISTTNQVPVTDTDIWVYDRSFNAIPGYGNDDSGAGNPQSLLTRTYAAGTYYVAISTFNLINEQGSPADDSFRTGAVGDFAGVAVNSLATTNGNMTFRISDGVTSLQVTNTQTGHFDINWYVFTVYTEAEPNDSKAAATPVGPMVAGNTIVGNTTGAVLTPGSTSVDYYLVTVGANPLGIYRHRLVITSPTAGHTGTLRGLSQSAGVINAGTDSTLQTSSASTTPPRFNQFYTFGAASQLYYRVTGSAGTTGDYTATLETLAVTPANIGNYGAGSITLNSMNQGHGTDTEFWVYNQSLNAIPDYGNDDNSITGGGTGAGLQSLFTRNYTPGTYYVALSTFQFGNNQPSPTDDDNRTGIVMDFSGVAVASSTTPNQNVTFTISDGTSALQVPSTKAGAYDVNWFLFTVVARPQISQTFRSGTNVVIAGTGGSPGGTYYVKTSTNIALPLFQWTPVATNLFDGSGNFRYTNAIGTNLSAQFFTIALP